MFGDVPTCSGCIQNRRPYGRMPLECIQVDSELILCQDPITVLANWLWAVSGSAFRLGSSEQLRAAKPSKNSVSELVFDLCVSIASGYISCAASPPFSSSTLSYTLFLCFLLLSSM
jgi:hypothetical protein